MKKVVGIGVGALALLFGAVNQASAALVINEFVINPPGTDNGNEWVEIKGNASESVSGVWLLWIDGDSGGATGVGITLNAVDLTAAGTVGTNGLLIIRDSATVMLPAPAGATTVFVNDFAPDIDQDSGTFLLVTAFTGTANLVTGSDIDTNDDGVSDATFWTTVLDSIGLIDNGGGAEFSFADDFGGTTINSPGGYNPDFMFRAVQTGQWEHADIAGTSPGPWTIDAVNNSNVAFGGQTLSPGNDNSNTLDVEVSETSVE